MPTPRPETSVTFCRGGKSGVEDEIEDFAVGEAGAVLHQAHPPRFLQDLFADQSAAVVGDLNDDMPGLVAGTEANPPCGILAGGAPLFGEFQAVIGGIADHVHQAVGQFLHHIAIEFGLGRRSLPFSACLPVLRPGRAPGGSSFETARLLAPCAWTWRSSAGRR